ncbi:hypothetical protein C8N43_2150 [Litoreibacter ponti]|uniref:Uncharacterized protein n=1 Tax=Litoreibacter ponti TaxID=1510457 RepID=A0A2T6BN11_9RHOB|nr:hypothetical protein [Litoreibacter ponti]PTX57480.1 hypothetical protein C8N43_2150 [Litoreibacter ponti]
MNILFDVIQSVFKPSLVALSIAFGVAIISFNGSPYSVDKNSIDLTNLSCPVVMDVICGPGSIFK